MHQYRLNYDYGDQPFFFLNPVGDCFTELYSFISVLFLGPAFCQHVSSSMYHDTVKNLTNTELFVLLRNIDENTKYSVKEKNRLLAQFYKGHPDIFAQYFGSRLSTISLSEV